MENSFEIPISKVQAREILLKVPVEFKELVAVTSAVLASSQTYQCPFCDEMVSVNDTDINLHKMHCIKTF